MEFMKKIHLNLFIYIITILFNIVASSENYCYLKQYTNREMRSKMKCKTVSVGYNICIDETKIYSFNSLLTKKLYEYDFSSIIKVSDTHLLGKVAIEEFKVDNIKNNIIVCFIQTSYLFVLSYKGEFIFKDQIDEQFKTDNYFKLILYNNLKQIIILNLFYTILIVQQWNTNIFFYIHKVLDYIFINTQSILLINQILLFIMVII